MAKVKVTVGPFSRRPENSAFKQQRLPAWSLSLTSHTVLPIFYSLSIVCILLGVWLFITVENTQQLKFLHGRKEVVLTTLTWFGGKNSFLPIAYLVSGGMIFIVGIILTVVYDKVGRDAKNLEE